MTGSLSELSTFVPDAFLLKPETPFVPENIQLGIYTFLPWHRVGVAAAVTGPAAGQPRAEFKVSLPVEAEEAAGPLTVEHELVVRGPGDVINLDSRQILRRYPRPGTANAEDNYLAHVEFARPDLPWLFSPFAPAADRLQPWLALVVLEADLETQVVAQDKGLPPKVGARLRDLQPLDDAWAWAHAQVIGPKADGASGSIADRLGPDHDAVNLSRIACPRHLRENTHYIACLVPTFDAGVKAGLGIEAPGTLGPAWPAPTGAEPEDERIPLPVYDHWTFATGDDGDFEALAERLDPIEAPWAVGRRIVDTDDLGNRLPELALDAAGRVQVLRGPLVSPSDDVPPGLSENAAWPPTETEALRDQLNRADDLAAGDPGAEYGPRGIPIVGPPIYALHHAAVSRVAPDRDADWFGELNMDPRHRVVAGLGTRVVQMDQEDLMQAAWAQVGAIELANRRIRWAQMARFAGASLHARHLDKLALGDLLQLTRRVHGRLLAESELTVFGAVQQSAVASAAASATFRRLTRPLGPLARYAAGEGRAQLQRLVATDGEPRDFRRPYREVDCVGSISEAAAEAIDPETVSRVYDAGELEPERSARLLLDQGEKLAASRSVTDAMTPEALERSLKLDPGFRISDFGGAIANATLERAFHRGEPEEAGRAFRDRLAEVLGAAREIAPESAAQGLVSVAKELVRDDWPAAPERPPLGVARESLLAAVQPAVTITARIAGRLGELPGWIPSDWFDDQLVEPIMAAPTFPRPMYEALDAYDRDWLIPGLGTIKETDFVTLLETNEEFMEAFLVGLSHEMGRELLWREYPTDQRGSYFRQFWRQQATDPAQRQAAYDLAQQIHTFTRAPLGQHIAASLQGKLVFLIRGELIRRYPDAIVLALRAGKADDDGRPEFIDLAADPSAAAPILFHAHLEPDITLTGFDLKASDVRAAPDKQGWWFVVTEHPTGPRFGLDTSHATETPEITRQTLAWITLAQAHAPEPPPEAPPLAADLPVRALPDRRHSFLDARAPAPPSVPDTDVAGAPTTIWGHDAGGVAHLLLQDPVRAAFEGKKMLDDIGVNP